MESAALPFRKILLSTPVIMKLKQLAPVTKDDQAALLDALQIPCRIAARSEISRVEESFSRLQFIQQGYAYRFVMLRDGRRQITDFLLPGDICNPHGSSTLDEGHGVCALTSMVYCGITSQALTGLVDDHPRIGEALWHSALLNEAMLYNRVISLGQRSAKERLAHFLCEVFVRSRTVGLTSGLQCSFPMNQNDLADLLGLSVVQTNRSMMALRADGMIRLQAQVFTIFDVERLQELAHFDPRYLQVNPKNTVYKLKMAM